MRTTEETIKAVLNHLEKKGVEWFVWAPLGGCQTLSVVETIVYLRDPDEWARQQLELTKDEFYRWKEDHNRCVALIMKGKRKGERCTLRGNPYCRIHSREFRASITDHLNKDR